MTKKYYDIREDFEKYPDAWAFFAWSKRGPGKTYSTLRYMIEENKQFCLLKRTIEDVKMLCANGRTKGVEFDVSPFKPLNRDFGWDIVPQEIVKGIAGFYHSNEEGKPYGAPVGYCAALSASKDIKGFDMSEVDYLIYDEFIPKKHERINRKEGQQLLEIYMTLRRDRLLRGREDLKLLCLANATSVHNPTFEIFDIIDDAVIMDVCGIEYTYIEDRGLLLHCIPAFYVSEEKKSGIEKAMAGTSWYEMAFGGHFAYDDFTSVKRQKLKGYRPICSYYYNKREVYIYEKEGYYYATESKAKVATRYNLERENEQKRFYYEVVMNLRDAVIADRFTFQKYTQYELVMDYKKIFQI